MDWIKKNVAQCVLAVAALLLLVSSGGLIVRALGYRTTFAGIQGVVQKKTNIPPLDTTALDAAIAALDRPGAWAVISGSSSLFVSEKYLVKDGRLVDPTKGGEPLHPPVPNTWFVANQLDLLSNTVLEDDPDGDGFTNYDEWVGNGSPEAPQSTNPNDPQSHPPYYTKLVLKEAISRPFRLVFMSRPDDETAAINTVDYKQPTVFVKRGEMVRGTKFKVVKFDVKTRETEYGPRDASELTLEHVETGQQLVLPIEKMVNSPDSFARLRLEWKEGAEFVVKHNQKFRLDPEPNVEYKLVDIATSQALIENLATGERIKVLPPKAAKP